MMLFIGRIAVVDNLPETTSLSSRPTLDNAYETGRKRLKELLSRLRQPLTIPIEKPTESGSAVCEFSEAEFIAAVERAKHYIVEGDIMQAVLSQRTSKPYSASPLALYRARAAKPHLMFYYHLEHYIVGASRNRRLEMALRSVTPDCWNTPTRQKLTRRFALADLLPTPKSVLRHVMLMDLGRNDMDELPKWHSQCY